MTSAEHSIPREARSIVRETHSFQPVKRKHLENTPPRTLLITASWVRTKEEEQHSQGVQ